MVPLSRIRTGNPAAVRADGEFVLYWMIAFRRLSSNFSLQRAVELAVELQKPLVIFESLRIGYRWASERIHRFVIDGMAENAARIAALKNPGVLYFPYVELLPDADKGLLAALAEHACVVVTDDFPSFFLPRMVLAAASRLPVQLESVDSNGLLPLSPYLHFGHISSHELFHKLMSREVWSPASLGEKTGGKREGWWGASPGAESWLDEFITWRELGYNMTSHRDDYDQFESLPDWAQATLANP
jgi:hypothetical protein